MDYIKNFCSLGYHKKRKLQCQKILYIYLYLWQRAHIPAILRNLIIRKIDNLVKCEQETWIVTRGYLNGQETYEQDLNTVNHQGIKLLGGKIQTYQNGQNLTKMTIPGRIGECGASGTLKH